MLTVLRRLPATTSGIVYPILTTNYLSVRSFADNLFPTRSTIGETGPIFSPASPATSPAAARIAGRSMSVQNENAPQTFRRLHAMLNRNRVQRELRQRARYEKPTQRRQREKKQSAMRQFQIMVARKVRLVMQMKNRGM